MKVSVLIPTYNSEPHLSECLDSVLAQDFADMEILLTDDGSTDQTAKIIETYAVRDARIRWWQNPANLGIVGNHNEILRRAQGDYVKFLHADDKLLAPYALSKMAVTLEENPSVVLVGCRQHLTGAKSRPLIFSNRSGRFDGKRMIVASLEQNTNLIGQPSLTMFRRRAAQRGFDPRFTGHLDFEMWCCLLEQGDFFYLAEDLATWRVHGNQQTARHEKHRIAEHEHLLFMQEFLAKPWLQNAATQRMWFAQTYYLRKKYGAQADSVIATMQEKLAPGSYSWQLLKHKCARPLQNLAQKIRS